jgi:hypothetical protein
MLDLEWGIEGRWFRFLLEGLCQLKCRLDWGVGTVAYVLRKTEWLNGLLIANV